MAYMEKLREGTLAGAIEKCVCDRSLTVELDYPFLGLHCKVGSRARLTGKMDGTTRTRLPVTR